MKKVATLAVVALFVTLLGTATAEAQVSVSVNIGFSVPVYPELVLVPDYPVYYAPSVRANYFFYDGLYWVFNVEDGYWYSSSWYNGPWVYVEPVYVPQFILVIPFRYYRVRPAYWSGWAYDAPPRWGQQWGAGWESSRRGWERWDRSHVYVAAPLPLYQKNYARDRYPSPSQQVIIHNEQYHYQSVDVHVREQRTTILRQQSEGGAKARGRAEGVAAQPQRQEKAQRQDKSQGPEKGQRQEKSQDQGQPPQRQDKSQGPEKGQRQEKSQDQGQPPQRQDKSQGPEKGQRQEKSQDQGQPPQRQDKSQGPEKGQRQEKSQDQGQPPQRQDKSQGPEKGQRQEKSQDQGQPPQRQEKSQGPEKGQRQEKGQGPEKKALGPEKG